RRNQRLRAFVSRGRKLHLKSLYADARSDPDAGQDLAGNLGLKVEASTVDTRNFVGTLGLLRERRMHSAIPLGTEALDDKAAAEPPTRQDAAIATANAGIPFEEFVVIAEQACCEAIAVDVEIDIRAVGKCLFRVISEPRQDHVLISSHTDDLEDDA